EGARGASAIEDLDLAHRRGQAPETLNYANAAETAVQIWAGGKKAGEAIVKRSGLNPRTLTPPDDELGRGPIAVAPAPGAAQGARGGRGAAGRGSPNGPKPGGGPAAPGRPQGARRGAEAGPPEGAGTGPGGGTQAPAPPAATEAGGAGGGFGAQVVPIPPKTFDLASAYTIDGWLRDSDVDLRPDGLETAILVGDAADSSVASHIS